MGKCLKVENLKYQKIHNLNLSFETNKTYTIIGSNNSGKTTLFRLFSGLIKTNNAIKCDNISLNATTRNAYIQKIGVVSCVNQKSFLFDNVQEEMTYPLANLGYPQKNINQQIKRILKQFTMQEILSKKISELTIYEQEMLLIMIALLHQPKILLIDEALDIYPLSYQKKIMDVLVKIKDLCIINFTSNLNEALLGDEVIILNKYHVVKKITTEEMYDDDKIFYENNLEIPFICDLNIKLRMYNLIYRNYDNVKDMVDDIWE